MKLSDKFYSSRSRYPAMFYPMGHYYPYTVTDRFEKTGTIIQKNMRYDFYYPSEAVPVFNKFFIQKVEASEYLDEIEEHLERYFSKLKNHTLTFNENENVSLLLTWYKRYSKIYKELNYPSIILFVLASDAFSERVKKVVTDPGDFQSIAISRELPYVTRYERDMLQGDVIGAVKMRKKWFWIPYNYHGEEEWDIEHFKNELAKTDEKRLHEIENYVTRRDSNNNKIFQKYSLSEKEKEVVTKYQQFIYLQDRRKELTNRTYPVYQSCIQRIAKNSAVTKEEIWVMCEEEIEAAVNGSKKRYLQRIDRAVAIHSRSGLEIRDEIPDEYLDTTDDQKGIWGISGSKGVAVGIVKVCIRAKDVKNMKEGQVLVAPSTTPDFIMGFRKACAVVTDEGGLTSHAAIVSRELNIPCVLGTKNATQVLKDGMEVEVDAGSGVVRILK